MRLIDAKELERQTKEVFKENPVVMGMLLRWIRKQPTIDVATVVRCNECKRSKYRKSPFGVLTFTCELLCADIKPDDFCSYGERKDT